MNWRCGSSGTTTALQAQSPEFKPQSHQKKKNKLSIIKSIFLIQFLKRT
jgi:hypothetical protein